MKYNKQWEYIPFSKRDDVYSNSIKMHHYLWIVPTYNPGEVWAFYGTICDSEHEIVQLYKDSNQILTRTQDGKRHIYIHLISMAMLKLVRPRCVYELNNRKGNL